VVEIVDAAAPADCGLVVVQVIVIVLRSNVQLVVL
jgi:hypothetical protein